VKKGHGCETQAVMKQMKLLLKILEWKILRKIRGPMKAQNGWRIQTNDELQVTYKNLIL
jgi:hypothetical protein